jgi:hypothetical protein
MLWLMLRLPLCAVFFFFCILFGIEFMLSDSHYLFLLQDSDMAIDDIVASSLGGDDPQTTAVDQDEDLGKNVADSLEADVESTEGGHSASNDSFFDTTPGSVPEEQMMSAGSAADDDDTLRADDSNIGSPDLMIHDLAIVPHASHSFEHGHDGDDAADPNTVPLSISVPQTVLTSRITGMFHSATIPFELL